MKVGPIERSAPQFGKNRADIRWILRDYYLNPNCGELMAAHSYVIHSGTVDVAVLPPIYTDDWSPDNMDEQVEGVRQQFIDVLTDWPRG